MYDFQLEHNKCTDFIKNNYIFFTTQHYIIGLLRNFLHISFSGERDNKDILKNYI